MHRKTQFGGELNSACRTRESLEKRETRWVPGPGFSEKGKKGKVKSGGWERGGVGSGLKTKRTKGPLSSQTPPEERSEQGAVPSGAAEDLTYLLLETRRPAFGIS